MATRFELLQEADRRGLLQGDLQQEYLAAARVKEAGDRAAQEVAEDVGPLESVAIGAGRGFTTLGRGIGLVDSASDAENEAYGALKEERPYTTGAGEILAEAAPFVIPGAGIARLGNAGRLAGATALGATEAGIIASGEGQDVASAAGFGGAIGLGAEVLLPVIGRIGGKVFRDLTGRAPQGSLLTPDGVPTPEFQQSARC